MVSGAAALLFQAYPMASPYDIKARFMNSAETAILTSPQTAPGQLAPITRIGAGEVRVDRARQVRTLLSDAGDPSTASLSFGHHRATGISVLSKKVLVRNLADTPRTYSIATEFRYLENGAVTASVPAAITVPANGSATFTVTLTLNANLLAAWTLDGGPRGGDGFRLQTHEYDGYVKLTSGAETVRLPWQILTHKAANVRPASTSIALGGNASANLTLTNSGGAVDGFADSFSLVGSSGKFPTNVLPRPGDNFAVIDLKAVGVRMLPDINFGGSLGVQDLVQFAITTWGERSHPNYPAEFDVYIDVNNDGMDDYVAFNVENAGGTGQNITVLQNLATNEQFIRFFTVADLNSANAIYILLRSDLAGLTRDTKFRVSVYAFDNYYTGVLTDAITDMRYTLSAPRFTAPGTILVPAGGSADLSIGRNVSGDTASPSQSGILLMYTDAKTGQEADLIAVTP
jgi:hypothetical protein